MLLLLLLLLMMMTRVINIVAEPIACTLDVSGWSLYWRGAHG
jgi:hypothetical protein